MRLPVARDQDGLAGTGTGHRARIPNRDMGIGVLSRRTNQGSVAHLGEGRCRGTAMVFHPYRLPVANGYLARSATGRFAVADHHN